MQIAQRLGWNRKFTLLALSTGCFSLCFMLHATGTYNFVNDELGVKPDEFGRIESVREIPGFLTVVFAALAMQLPVPFLAGLCLIVMGLGISSFSLAQTVTHLILCSLVWSLGFHCWWPLRDALALTLSDEAKGTRLGQLRSVDGFGSLLGLGTFYWLFPVLGFRPLFVLAGGVALLGGLLSFPMAPVEVPVDQPRWAWKRKYGLYYALAFLLSYRLFFFVFSRYALVREFHVPAEDISVLMMVNTALSLFICPLIGRTVDRIGERRSLGVTFAGLALVFSGYACGRNVRWLKLLYVLDPLFATFSLASSTYLNKIAGPEDLRPALSMSMTIGHVVAVVMPLLSGHLWDQVGHRWVFAICTGLALVGLVVSGLVPESAGELKGRRGTKRRGGD